MNVSLDPVTSTRIHCKWLRTNKKINNNNGEAFSHLRLERFRLCRESYITKNELQVTGVRNSRQRPQGHPHDATTPHNRLSRYLFFQHLLLSLLRTAAPELDRVTASCSRRRPFMSGGGRGRAAAGSDLVKG